MSERVDHLTELVRYSFEVDITTCKMFVEENDNPKFDKMREAIEYFKKDGRTDIEVTLDGDHCNIHLKVIE